MITDSRPLLNQHFKDFSDLCDEAEAKAHAGDFEQAVRTAQAAADYAWYNHTGLFASHRLERLLAEISAAVLPPSTGNRPRSANPNNVLHVFSEAHEEAGGHIRLAWRWVQADGGRRHCAVAINHPGHWPLSKTLTAAVTATGGSITQLNEDPSTPLLDRAQKLREMATDFDCLVLHVHPYDVVPLLAFQNAEHAPIIFLNHADHVFWLGSSIADILACRPPGAALAQQRRGVAPGHLSLLPQTIDTKAQGLSKEVAKRKLGIDTGLTVLLCATASYKLAPVDEYDFLALTADALAQREDCVMILIAAGETAHLQPAIEKANGRIALLPRQDSLEAFYDAADIFLNPYPFPSMTAFLEAGMHDAAVIGFDPNGERDVLSAENFYTAGVVVEGKTPEEYRSLLVKLIEDDTYRNGQATVLRELVTTVHTTPRWNNWMEHCYADAMSAEPAQVSNTTDEPRHDRVDQMLVLMHQRGAMFRELSYVRQAHGISVGTVDREPAVPAATTTPPTTPAPLEGLSVVTVVQPGDTGFIQALQSVLESRSGLSVQFIAVDNASTGETKAALEELAEDIEVIRSDTPELPLDAWIAGIERAQNELVLLLSTDVRLADGWLTPAVETLNSKRAPVTLDLRDENGVEMPVAGPDTLDGVCLLLTRTLLATDLDDAVRSNGPSPTLVRR